MGSACVPMQRTANRTGREHRSMMRTLEGKVSKQREMTGHRFSITSKHGCSVPAGADEGATNLKIVDILSRYNAGSAEEFLSMPEAVSPEPLVTAPPILSRMAVSGATCRP